MSATLLQKAEGLRERMAKVQAAESSKQTLDVWQPLREKLPEYRQKLENLVKAMRVMHAQGLLSGDRLGSTQLAGLVKQLGELRDCLLHQPEKVMQKSRWAKTDVEITGAAKLLERNLLDSWQGYVATIAPKLDDWLPFFQVDRFGPQLRKIKTLREELQSLGQTLPADAQALEHAQSKGSQIHELRNKLDFGDIPLAVKAFLKRALDSIGGATLADLDPEVLTWLREKQLTHAFRIMVGGR